MKFNLKKERGITLIALVITIIVLLILAGVTIASITGENGILSKATQASQKTIQWIYVKFLDTFFENFFIF